jgi:hypothetical protein
VPDVRRQRGWTIWVLDDEPDTKRYPVCPDCITSEELASIELADEFDEDGVPLET